MVAVCNCACVCVRTCVCTCLWPWLTRVGCYVMFLIGWWWSDVCPAYFNFVNAVVRSKLMLMWTMVGCWLEVA